MADLLEVPTAEFEFSSYDEIRDALFNKHLSRSFDKRSYEEGNIRDGVVSITHGGVHRARRRLENRQFRADQLRLYERELFPQVLNDIFDELISGERADLFPLGEIVSVVLAAKRAGLEYDPTSPDHLHRLVSLVDDFSQGSAILDAKDPEAVRTMVRRALDDFDKEFLQPSIAVREDALRRCEAGEISKEELPHDILTVLLMHRDDPKLELHGGRLGREVATYLQGGTHTSSQTLINTLDLLFPLEESQPGVLDRVTEDRAFAQRCVHETLRLRPTTPRIKRRAEDDTEVGGTEIPKDSLVVLNVLKGNRDPEIYGPDAEEFNPDRSAKEGFQLWGLSFGAGPHVCPGRTVAGGLPLPQSDPADDEHLFGLVAQMVQAVTARGVRPDPDQEPERDTRTERFTRWATYPVIFGKRPSPVGG